MYKLTNLQTYKHDRMTNVKLKLQTYTQNMLSLLLFHYNNVCTRAPQCYVIRTSPVGLMSDVKRRLRGKTQVKRKVSPFVPWTHEWWSSGRAPLILNVSATWGGGECSTSHSGRFIPGNGTLYLLRRKLCSAPEVVSTCMDKILYSNRDSNFVPSRP